MKAGPWTARPRANGDRHGQILERYRSRAVVADLRHADTCGRTLVAIEHRRRRIGRGRRGVVSGSAAEEAGVRGGDRIIAINGKAIRSTAQLDAKLSASDGRRLTIDIDRGGARSRVRAATRAMAFNSGKVLGIVHWDLRFAPSDDPGETYIPPPPIPPPPDPPPPIPPQ
jgi:membrane-associated protease RseP (regulator of RpoE activity)